MVGNIDGTGKIQLSKYSSSQSQHFSSERKSRFFDNWVENSCSFNKMFQALENIEMHRISEYMKVSIKQNF